MKGMTSQEAERRQTTKQGGQNDHPTLVPLERLRQKVLRTRRLDIGHEADGDHDENTCMPDCAAGKSDHRDELCRIQQEHKGRDDDDGQPGLV